jgi:protein-tyrosine phosphatase
MSTDRVVLFVCTGNYYRSRYAEHYFNAHAAGTGWRADSRGFEPSPLNPGPINSQAAARLASGGLAIETHRDPIRLVEADLEQADLIVMLDEDEHRHYIEASFPGWIDRVVYWRIADLWGMTIDEALAAIEQKVDALIEELRRDDRP